MRTYLIVANQTLTDEHLLEEVRARSQAGEAQFHVVVPMRHPGGTWNEGMVRGPAEARLQEGLAALRDLGIEATGEVGDASPVRAIGDALIARRIDEVLLSTLPSGPSKWLRADVVRRAQRAHPGVTITHVVGSAQRVEG